MILPGAMVAESRDGIDSDIGDDNDTFEYAERLDYYSSTSSSSSSPPPLELYDDKDNGNMSDNDGDHDDGSDHANNDNESAFGEIRRHPQHYYNRHQQHQHYDNDDMNHPYNHHHHHHHHATPHGNMTSILSAAGSHSPQKKLHNQQQRQNNNSQQHNSQKKSTTIAMSGGQQKNMNSSEDNATSAAKRALRSRASKYFHRGGGGAVAAAASVTSSTDAETKFCGKPSNSTSNSERNEIDNPNNNGSVEKSHGNGKNDNTHDMKMDTTDKQEEVEFVDEKGVIRIVNQRPTSNTSSSSSNATTALLSSSTSSLSNSRDGTAAAAAARTKTTTTITAEAASASQCTLHGNSSLQSSLSFFPRTTSSSSSLLSTRNLIHYHHHQQQKQNQEEKYPHPSSEENIGDPSLQTYLSPSSSYDNLLEVQSNATSGYTSGGGGSDLEVAARRILRGKKERGMGGSAAGGKNRRGRHHPSIRSGGVTSESDDDDRDFTDDDDNIGVINLGHSSNMSGKKNCINDSNNNKRNGRALPPGWKERIQRKTGMQLLKVPSAQPPLPPPMPSSSSSSSIPPPATQSIAPSNNIVSTATKTDFSTASKETTTNPIDYSYCYPSDDNDDSCNQLGVYCSDGKLAMTKRARNANGVSPVAAAAPSITDYDKNEWNVSNEAQRPQHQDQDQYEEVALYPERHPPTPSPTESIETTYHLEDLENNGAFPTMSHSRNNLYGQNGDNHSGHTAQSVRWPLQHHQQQEPEQEQRRLPVVHEHHNPYWHPTSDCGYDDTSDSYDAEKEEENIDFGRHCYSQDKKEEMFTETVAQHEHDPFQAFEPILINDRIYDTDRPSNDDDVDHKIRSFNISSNNRFAPIIINEYGFPPIPINPDIAHFGDNYYVKEEGLRLSNNNYFISQRSQRIASPSLQETDERQVHFASSALEGKIGSVAVKGGRQEWEDGEMHGHGVGDVGISIKDNDKLNSDGFDDNEYFDRFYYSSLAEVGPRHDEEKKSSQHRWQRRENDGCDVLSSGDWEEIPAAPKVQWASTSSSRRNIQTSSINEFNGTKTGDSDSSKSVLELTTSSLNIALASATNTEEVSMFAGRNVDGGNYLNNISGARQGVSSRSHRTLQNGISKKKFLVESDSVMNDITQSPSWKKSRSQQQRVHALYDQWVQESKKMQLSAQKTAEYSLSDGDVSDKGYGTGQSAGEEDEIGTKKTKKRATKLFGGRNRAYNSEGERSDTSVEGDRIKGSLSFNFSPLRSGKRESKKDKKKGGLGNKGKTPRRMRLFGHTNHHNLDDSIDINGNNPPARNEPDVEGEAAQSLLIDAGSNKAGIGQSSVASAFSTATEHINDSITESEVDAIREASTSLDCSRELDSTTMISDNNEQEDDHPQIISNLNDSRETHSTPIASNAKAQMMLRLSRAHSIPPRAATRTNKDQASGIPLRPGQIPGSAKELSPNRPEAKQTYINDQIASQRKPGWTPAPIQSECVDDDTVSTLGSLVTKDTETRSAPAPEIKAHFSSDASTVTELSEIERLRRENDRLREKLENSSQLSSRVTTMYAESLKLENYRLRQEYGNASQRSAFAERHGHRRHKNKTSLESNHRTTLETLLEKGNDEQIKKSRRRAKLDSAVADFNHLPPVAHLINGVDFDDDSLTSNYSLNGYQSHVKYVSRGNGCETPDDLVKKTCTRIATTTRSFASQMKLALAQDSTNGSDTAPSSRPLNCFTKCSREKTNDGTTVYVTEKQFNSLRGSKASSHRVV